MLRYFQSEGMVRLTRGAVELTDIKKLDSQYIAPTYGRADLCLDHGKGSTCFDVDGKKYIDLGAGIAVNGFGFCDEEYISAVTEQLSKIQHTSNLYYTAPQAKLAELLCIRTGMKKVFFSNSGAEANECAIKAVRKYSQDKKGKEYYNRCVYSGKTCNKAVNFRFAGSCIFHGIQNTCYHGF